MVQIPRYRRHSLEIAVRQVDRSPGVHAPGDDSPRQFRFPADMTGPRVRRAMALFLPGGLKFVRGRTSVRPLPPALD